MAWETYKHDTQEYATKHLSDKILRLMHKAIQKTPAIPMDGYLDDGIEIDDDTTILVHREMEECLDDDIETFTTDTIVSHNGHILVPGYTLTIQFSDQQWTETFFAEDSESELRHTANLCAQAAIDYITEIM